MKISHLFHVPYKIKCKGKGLPRQAEVAQGFPGRLRPRIFLTFGTTRVVGRHRSPLPQEKSLLLIFRSLVDPRAHSSVVSYEKKSPVTNLRCVIPVVLSQILQCIMCMYLHIHEVRNTTIIRLYHYVIYITVQYTTCFGLINGPFIRPKHVVVY